MLDGLFPPEAAERLTHLVVFADAGARYRRGARHKARNVHWNRFVVNKRPPHVINGPAHKHGVSLGCCRADCSALSSTSTSSRISASSSAPPLATPCASLRPIETS
ncbi:hypothetical protein V8D89_007914 [Ganoderma adspersum]